MMTESRGYRKRNRARGAVGRGGGKEAIYFGLSNTERQCARGAGGLEQQGATGFTDFSLKIKYKKKITLIGSPWCVCWVLQISIMLIAIHAICLACVLLSLCSPPATQYASPIVSTWGLILKWLVVNSPRPTSKLIDYKLGDLFWGESWELWWKLGLQVPPPATFSKMLMSFVASHALSTLLGNLEIPGFSFFSAIP